MSSPSVIEGRRRSRCKRSSILPLKLRRSWGPYSHARSGLPNVVPASVPCPHEANSRNQHSHRKTRSACQACCRPKSSASLIPEHVVTAKPSFEAMNHGSWSEIEIISFKNGKVLVHYVGTSSENDEELSIDHLRLLSRQATDWDCTNTLMEEMDVCIFDKTHAKTNTMRRHDARLAKIDKRPHTPNCDCQFTVQFYNFQQGQLPNESPSDDVKRVGLDKILVLQKPRKLSFMECLAVATNSEVKEKKRWSNDARFLRDQSDLMKINGEGHNLPPVESMPTGSNVLVNRNEQTKGLPILDRQISCRTVPTGNIKDIQDDKVILSGNRKVIQDNTALIMENSKTIQHEASLEKEGKAIQRKVIQNGNNCRKKQVVNKDALLKSIKPVLKKIEVESVMENEKIGKGVQAERALAEELGKIKASADELEKMKPITEETRDEGNGNASVEKLKKCGKIIQDESREIIEEHGNTLLETKKALTDERILQEDAKKDGRVIGSLLGKRNIDEKAVQDESPLLGKTKEEENGYMKTGQVCQNTSTRRKKTKIESGTGLDAFFNGCHKKIPKESPEVAKLYWDESFWGEKINTEAELDTKDELQDIWDDMDIAFSKEELGKVDNSRMHPLEVCKCSHARSGLPNVVPASVPCPHEANSRNQHSHRKTRSACQACCRPKSSASLIPERVVTAKPSFEAMNHGSWSEIEIISFKNGKVLVHYVGTSSENDEELSINQLRLLSRQATDWDCTNTLMEEMDVCIFDKTDAKTNTMRWHDARLAKIDKRPHTPNCDCEFTVQFCDFQQGQLPNGSPSDDVKRVGLDKILVLQKPRKLSFMECLAVATNSEVKEKRRWSNDARFLRDQFDLMKINGEGHNLPPVESLPTGSNVLVNRNEQTKGLPLLDRQISCPTVPTGNIKDIQDDKVILSGNRKVIQDNTALIMENSEIIQHEKASLGKEGKAIQDESVQRKVIQNGNNSRKKQVVNKDALLKSIKPVLKKIEVESVMENEKIGKGVQAERALAEELGKIKASADELEKMKPITEETRDEGNGNASVEKVRKCGKIIQDESREIIEEHGNTLLETKKALTDERILQEDAKKDGRVIGSLLGKRNIDEKAVQDESPLLGKTKEEENRYMKTGQVCQNTSTRRKKTKIESGTELDAFFNGCHKKIPKESPEVAKLYWDESFWGEKINTEAELDTKDELQDIWDDMDIAFAKEEVGKVDNSRMHPLKVCKCGHTYSLDDDEGYVCDGCGNVGLAIEEILPKLIFKPSKKEANNGNNVFDQDEDKSDCEMPSCFEYTNVENGQLEASTDLQSVLQKHQKEGFDFLWTHLGGNQGNHGGCILSHAPGTGKTLLIIYFLHRYLQDNPVCNTLIVAPNAMLCPWEGEFLKWKVNIPVYILNGNKKYVDSDEGEAIFSGSPRDISRLSTLKCWLTNKSVLLISYKLFANLITGETSIQQQKMREIILERTGLLILDEGHFPRATKTIVRRALMKVKTKNRILLSGTLFQNNFEELFNTLNLVREGFYENAPESDARRNFLQVVGNRYVKGQAKEELERNFELLRKVSDSFVHHYAGEVLASLPGLFDYVIMLRPTSHQDDLLKKAMPKWERHINLETAITGICIHPSLICDLKFKDTIEVDHDVMKQLREVAEAGVKTKFVMDLLNTVKSTSEKVLIFSEKLYPFKLLEALIEQTFHWIRGREVLRVDGSQSMDERQSIIDRFNQHSEARVLFASIRACGEGISLTGASRIVFLHMVWNAAVMRQAVSRAFRLGQKRRVFVYRLVASKTLEEEKYRTTLWKEWVSGSIYDASPSEAIPTDTTTGASSSQGGPSKGVHLEDVLLEKLLEHDKDTGMFVKVMEHHTESYLSDTSDMDNTWADIPDENDNDTDIEDENDL